MRRRTAFAGRAAMAVAMAVALFLTVCARAPAHESGPGYWISTNGLTDPLSGHSCCNKNDCEAVPPGGVAETTDGYLLAETGELIEKERVIWKSQDGQWWRCRYLSDRWVRNSDGRVFNSGETRCLIGPPPNS